MQSKQPQKSDTDKKVTRSLRVALASVVLFYIKQRAFISSPASHQSNGQLTNHRIGWLVGWLAGMTGQPVNWPTGGGD